MNPYEFVRFAGEPERDPAPGRLRFGGLSGTLTCTMTVRTALFTYQPSHVRWAELEGGGRHAEAAFPLHGGRPVVPAASLKGMVRGVAEAASRSCVSIFEGRYERGAQHRDFQSLLPPSYRRCQRPEALCPACRLFGTGQQVAAYGSAQVAPSPAAIAAPPLWSGCVAFSDAVAVPDAHVLAEPWTLAPESPPKPHHDAFYLVNGRLAGRKFYVHQPQGPKPYGEKTADNRTIQPLVAGSRLQFSVEYELLSEEDRRLLLYSLVLEPGLGHKLGLGKPLGLGSVAIGIDRLTIRDGAARYRTGANAKAEQTFEGDEVVRVLDEELRPYRSSQSFFLLDLRRALRMEHREEVGYPSAAWFRANPTVPLRQVNAPGQRAGLPPAPVPMAIAPPRPATAAQRPTGMSRPAPATTHPVGLVPSPTRLATATPPRPQADPQAPQRPRERPSAPPPPEPVPAVADAEREPDRAFTMEDLLARFGRGGETGPSRERPDDRARRRPTRADRAREDQRRILDRLRGEREDE